VGKNVKFDKKSWEKVFSILFLSDFGYSIMIKDLNIENRAG
jgi:hypothetical protein